MKAADVQAAVTAAALEEARVCSALDVTIPLLDELAKGVGGRRFWLGWGMRALVAALREYRQWRCGR
ncbi:MAG: hypothetical protein M0R75_01535 [Dehalococcoidia bacterium]|nr:hypothetical protein [Dehalococcoidia bacterium]